MEWKKCELQNGIQFLTGKNMQAPDTCIGFYFSQLPHAKQNLCALWAEMMLARLNSGYEKPLWICRTDWDSAAFTACEKSHLRDLTNVFAQCLPAGDWTEQELSQAAVRLEAKEQQRIQGFREMESEIYWHGNSCEMPEYGNIEELSSISLKQVLKWQQLLLAGGRLSCVFTGKLAERTMQSIRHHMEQLPLGGKDKQEKKLKKMLPKEYGERKKNAVCMLDTDGGTAEAAVSFDVPEGCSAVPVMVLCYLLNSGQEKSLAAVFHGEFMGMDAFSCSLEHHQAASRIVLRFASLQEEIAASLRRCFLALSYLKKENSEPQVTEWIRRWTEEYEKVCDDSEKINHYIGNYACTIKAECENLPEQEKLTSVSEVCAAIKKIFVPQNMTAAVSCQPGMMKHKKLQKIMVEAMALLHESQPEKEESEIQKKLVRQFVRDCQAEADMLLEKGESPCCSAYLIWKKLQCYIRLRMAADSHYSFDSVPSFLLGHGYSKEDIHRLKKLKKREKAEEGWEKQNLQGTWEEIEKWFFKDTAALIENLAVCNPWKGAEAAAVKRSNICMQLKERPERGMAAVLAMVEDKTSDFTRICEYLNRKEAER